MRRSARVLGTMLLTTGLLAGLGTMSTAATAATEKADLGRTDVAIAPAVYDLIKSAGITVKPTGGATADPYKGTVRAKFPITAVKRGGDKIMHDGGLKFSAGDMWIKTAQFTILVSDGVVTGKANGSEIGKVGRVPLFTLAATSDPDLGAVDLLLTDTAAGAINATFGTDFSEGDLFGHATPRPKD